MAEVVSVPAFETDIFYAFRANVAIVETDKAGVILCNGPREIKHMANWQVTAATLRCDIVGEEVTLLVYKDWSVKCTAYSKFATTRRAARKNDHTERCEGTECKTASGYLKKLQSEEDRG